VHAEAGAGRGSERSEEGRGDEREGSAENKAAARERRRRCATGG